MVWMYLPPKTVGHHRAIGRKLVFGVLSTMVSSCNDLVAWLVPHPNNKKSKSH